MVVLSLLLISCDEENTNCSNSKICYCNTENPINDLNWLKNIIEETEDVQTTDSMVIIYCNHYKNMNYFRRE